MFNSKNKFGAEYSKRINNVCDYIQTHMFEEINLEKMAAEAFFSVFHFHRIFTAMIGETPRDYIERLRLEKAANMLFVRNNMTITDISYKCGFSSPAVFSRAFKKHFGISASGFIKKHIEDYHSIDKPRQKENTGKSEFDPSEIEIKILPSFHLVFARSNNGYSKGISKAWDKIKKYAGARDLLNSTTRFIGIPFDNPGVTPEAKCRYYACITAPEDFTERGPDTGVIDVEGGKYAVYSFKGEAEEISRAYSNLYGIWLPQSGYMPEEKYMLEIYPFKQGNGCNKNIFEYDIALPVKPL